MSSKSRNRARRNPNIPIDSAMARDALWQTDLVRSTPLLSIKSIQGLDARLFLKDEGQQYSGSFKPWILGSVAIMHLAHMTPNWMICGSTGGQAGAVAGGARKMGTNAAVFIPAEAAPNKVAWLKTLGVEIHQVAGNYHEAIKQAELFAKVHGDAAYFIAHGGMQEVVSYGALGIEMLEEFENAGIDPTTCAILIPTGSYGLLAGVSRVVQPCGVRTIGVQTHLTDTLIDSLIEGKPLAFKPPACREDGIATGGGETAAFEICLSTVNAAVVVDSGAPSTGQSPVIEAIEHYRTAFGVEAEGAGVIPWLALTQSKALVTYLNTTGIETVVLVNTGRNVDMNSVNTMKRLAARLQPNTYDSSRVRFQVLL